MSYEERVHNGEYLAYYRAEVRVGDDEINGPKSWHNFDEMESDERYIDTNCADGFLLNVVCLIREKSVDESAFYKCIKTLKFYKVFMLSEGHNYGIRDPDGSTIFSREERVQLGFYEIHVDGS